MGRISTQIPFRISTFDPHEVPLLELRPNCECCNKDLRPDSPDAVICTFECTFCSDCAQSKLHGICPNCGGNLVARPIRPALKLKTSPASTIRVFKPGGCNQLARR